MKWTWSLAAVAAIISATGTTADDLATIKERRIADMGEFSDASTIAQIPDWLQSQKSDGTWPDVDYTTGCPASKFELVLRTKVVYIEMLTNEDRTSQLAYSAALEPNHCVCCCLERC